MTEEQKKALEYLIEIAEEEAIRAGEYTKYKEATEILEELLNKNK